MNGQLTSCGGFGRLCRAQFEEHCVLAQISIDNGRSASSRGKTQFYREPRLR